MEKEVRLDKMVGKPFNREELECLGLELKCHFAGYEVRGLDNQRALFDSEGDSLIIRSQFHVYPVDKTRPLY